jgi:hypothetical protein
MFNPRLDIWHSAKSPLDGSQVNTGGAVKPNTRSIIREECGIAPDLAMFERLNGWQLGHIIGWRSLIFALVIEIVATFGVALVWQPTRARKRPDHPRCLPGSPEGQQPSPDPGRSPCSPRPTDLLGKCRL